MFAYILRKFTVCVVVSGNFQSPLISPPLENHFYFLPTLWKLESGCCLWPEAMLTHACSWQLSGFPFAKVIKLSLVYCFLSFPIGLFFVVSFFCFAVWFLFFVPPSVVLFCSFFFFSCPAETRKKLSIFWVLPHVAVADLFSSGVSTRISGCPVWLMHSRISWTYYGYAMVHPQLMMVSCAG